MNWPLFLSCCLAVVILLYVPVCSTWNRFISKKKRQASIDVLTLNYHKKENGMWGWTCQACGREFTDVNKNAAIAKFSAHATNDHGAKIVISLDSTTED